jgi:hypothetical protein
MLYYLDICNGSVQYKASNWEHQAAANFDHISPTLLLYKASIWVGETQFEVRSPSLFAWSCGWIRLDEPSLSRSTFLAASFSRTLSTAVWVWLVTNTDCPNFTSNSTNDTIVAVLPDKQEKKTVNVGLQFCFQVFCARKGLGQIITHWFVCSLSFVSCLSSCLDRTGEWQCMDDMQLTGIQEAYIDSPVVLCRLLLALNGIRFMS